MGSDKARPAFVEEEDEKGHIKKETRRSASKALKIQPRSGKSSSNSSRKTIDLGYAESSRAIQHVELMPRDLARRSSSSGKSPRKTRPPSTHESRGFPKVSIPASNLARQDPSYYGMPAPLEPPTSISTASQPMVLAHRQRALTTNMYSPTTAYQPPPTAIGCYPPLSSSAYYGHGQMVGPSYPPPPSPSYKQYTAPIQQPDYGYLSQADYGYQNQQIVPRPLADRFQRSSDPIPRATSAFGTRDTPRSSYLDSYPMDTYSDDGYNSATEHKTIRKKKERRKSTAQPSPLSHIDDDDYTAMSPPTPRAGILRRSPVHSYEPSDILDSRPVYPGPSRPRHMNVSYELDHGGESVRVESANSSRRRQSHYDQTLSTISSGYESKLQQAASYQEDVTGPSTPLTAETLRKQQKRQDGSSRSTKSSASRDESDYKKSVTTRTTRSGSGNDDENMTIKVTGQARVMVGGAQIDCPQGGAIEIKRDRNTSERPSSEYANGRKAIEDRRSRHGGPSSRSRVESTQPFSRQISSAYHENSGEYF